MESSLNNRVLLSIMRQRHALTALRKDVLLSRTDIEVLAYAKLHEGVFNVYELKKYYSHTNIQQLRTSIWRLEKYGVLELISKGVKNKPSSYWVSMKGEDIIERYLKSIC